MHEVPTKITVEALVNAPLSSVWQAWTRPEDIVHWNHASDDWHSPSAESDLREGGQFVYRMEAKDGSMGFDFSGTFIKVKPEQYLEYRIDDNRLVCVDFTAVGDQTRVVEVFEAESMNSPELQQAGWQSILDQFKKYVESKA